MKKLPFEFVDQPRIRISDPFTPDKKDWYSHGSIAKLNVRGIVNDEAKSGVFAPGTPVFFFLNIVVLKFSARELDPTLHYVYTDGERWTFDDSQGKPILVDLFQYQKEILLKEKGFSLTKTDQGLIRVAINDYLEEKNCG